jgi:methylenetetrahydrofolate reductase (NADPH)
MTMSQDRRYSFEFFPTKTDAGHEKLMATAKQLASYNPDFFSCTYGAGGSTRDRTINTVLQLESEVKVPAAPHLSCVGDSKADLRGLLTQYKGAGIKRIVALRGDLPSGMGMASGELRYANELVEFLYWLSRLRSSSLLSPTQDRCGAVGTPTSPSSCSTVFRVRSRVEPPAP